MNYVLILCLDKQNKTLRESTCVDPDATLCWRNQESQMFSVYGEMVQRVYLKKYPIYIY
jgi:hypothetical protein